MIGHALAEITSHKPQNFSICSNTNTYLGVSGILQSAVISFGGQKLENMCSYHQLQTKYSKTSRESACEMNRI